MLEPDEGKLSRPVLRRGSGSNPASLAGTDGPQILRVNWLRVLRSAEAARIGPGVGQQRHTRAVRSEKCVRLRGRAWVGMRVIAVFFGPYAPDVLTAYGSVFSHDFKRLDRFTKLATSSLKQQTVMRAIEA